MQCSSTHTYQIWIFFFFLLWRDGTNSKKLHFINEIRMICFLHVWRLAYFCGGGPCTCILCTYSDRCSNLQWKSNQNVFLVCNQKEKPIMYTKINGVAYFSWHVWFLYRVCSALRIHQQLTFYTQWALSVSWVHKTADRMTSQVCGQEPIFGLKTWQTAVHVPL